MSKPLNLTIHPKAPPPPANKFSFEYDVWESQVATEIFMAEVKRFTDAELAAEYWKEFVSRSTLRSPNWLRAGTLHRFATTAHYDQGDN